MTTKCRFDGAHQSATIVRSQRSFEVRIVKELCAPRAARRRRIKLRLSVGPGNALCEEKKLRKNARRTSREIDGLAQTIVRKSVARRIRLVGALFGSENNYSLAA
jgi:hypothetical protein